MPNNDLISRKALIEQIEEDAKHMMFTSHHSRMLHDDMVEFAVNAIECAPAVDAVEVVRCKDCAHYHDDLCGKIQWIMDGYYNGTFERKQPLDFCSQAEKKGQST